MPLRQTHYYFLHSPYQDCLLSCVLLHTLAPITSLIYSTIVYDEHPSFIKHLLNWGVYSIATVTLDPLASDHSDQLKDPILKREGGV